MAYSARQMYGLKTMGLVAWSSGRARVANTGVPVVAASPDTMPAIETAIETVIEPIPASASDTVAAAQPIDWAAQLAAKTLETFSYRGLVVDCIGVDAAPLIVICSDDPCSSDKPMSGECMQLFDLMMHSIGVARNNLRLCAASNPAPVKNARSIASLIAPQTKAVLLLDGSMATDRASAQNPTVSTGHNADSARMPPSQLPVWRIPHPELLLSTPSLKRCAWENLKALKQVIALQDKV